MTSRETELAFAVLCQLIRHVKTGVLFAAIIVARNTRVNSKQFECKHDASRVNLCRSHAAQGRVARVCLNDVACAHARASLTKVISEESTALALNLRAPVRPSVRLSVCLLVSKRGYCRLGRAP